MEDSDSINIYEAKAHLSSLCVRAASGEDVILARHGQPWVKITALSKKPKVTFGILKGEVTIADDFDAPLPPDIQQTFEDS